jgi:hypothetical protein
MEAWRTSPCAPEISALPCPGCPAACAVRDATRRVPSMMMRERERDREREREIERERETTVHGWSFLKYSHTSLEYVLQSSMKLRLFTK